MRVLFVQFKILCILVMAIVSVKFCAVGCDVWGFWGLYADAVFTFPTVAELHLCLHIKFFPTLSIIFAKEVLPFN